MRNLPMKKMAGKRSRDEINIYIDIFFRNYFNTWKRERNRIDKSKGKNRKQ